MHSNIGEPLEGTFPTVQGTDMCSTLAIDTGKGREKEGTNWSIDVEVRDGVDSEKVISAEIKYFPNHNTCTFFCVIE